MYSFMLETWFWVVGSIIQIMLLWVYFYWLKNKIDDLSSKRKNDLYKIENRLPEKYTITEFVIEIEKWSPPFYTRRILSSVEVNEKEFLNDYFTKISFLQEVEPNQFKYRKRYIQVTHDYGLKTEISYYYFGDYIEEE